MHRNQANIGFQRISRAILGQPVPTAKAGMGVKPPISGMIRKPGQDDHRLQQVGQSDTS